jgi:hypothetical protein
MERVLTKYTFTWVGTKRVAQPKRTSPWSCWDWVCTPRGEDAELAGPHHHIAFDSSGFSLDRLQFVVIVAIEAAFSPVSIVFLLNFRVQRAHSVFIEPRPMSSRYVLRQPFSLVDSAIEIQAVPGPALLIFYQLLCRGWKQLFPFPQIRRSFPPGASPYLRLPGMGNHSVRGSTLGKDT